MDRPKIKNKTMTEMIASAFIFISASMVIYIRKGINASDKTYHMKQSQLTQLQQPDAKPRSALFTSHEKKPQQNLYERTKFWYCLQKEDISSCCEEESRWSVHAYSRTMEVQEKNWLFMNQNGCQLFHELSAFLQGYNCTP